MAMPETSLYKYYFFVPGQYNVRFSRQILPMQTKPKTKTVKYRSDNPLRLSVFAANSSH